MRQAAFVNLSEQLGLDGCKQLAEELKSRECTLQSIVAYWNSIDSAGAAVICDALAINSSVTKLNLWANTIDDVGAMAFASLIRRETVPLRELDLSRNNIGVGGIRAICEALRFNSSITYLDICGNYATVQQEWLDDMFASNFALQHLFSDFDPERQPQVVEAKLNRNKVTISFGVYGPSNVNNGNSRFLESDVGCRARTHRRHLYRVFLLEFVAICVAMDHRLASILRTHRVSHQENPLN